MEILDSSTRIQAIPVLYVKGTHYVVGFSIGRTFRSQIEELVESYGILNHLYIPTYETEKGRNNYEKVLNICEQRFPKYVEELKGISDGAKIPFYKLFLLHIDAYVPAETLDEYFDKTSTGCTSIICNTEDVILGHTEDTDPELLNRIFIVSAEICDEKGERIEKFSSLTYAGFLPGGTMGFNDHGLVHSINTLYPKNTILERTPTVFLMRALLRASTFDEVVDILKDSGCGTSNGFSVNFTLAKQEGSPVFHNAEIQPNEKESESDVNILTLTHGESHSHCNKYLRIRTDELEGCLNSSNSRHKVIGKFLKPTTKERVKTILSDNSNPDYPIFREGKTVDHCTTVAVGIFDIKERVWEIYVEPPNKGDPVARIPLTF